MASANFEARLELIQYQLAQDNPDLEKVGVEASQLFSYLLSDEFQSELEYHMETEHLIVALLEGNFAANTIIQIMAEAGYGVDNATARVENEKAVRAVNKFKEIIRGSVDESKDMIETMVGRVLLRVLINAKGTENLPLTQSQKTAALFDVMSERLIEQLSLTMNEENLLGALGYSSYE